MGEKTTTQKIVESETEKDYISEVAEPLDDGDHEEISVDAMNLLIYVICQPCWTSLLLAEAVQLLKSLTAS